MDESYSTQTCSQCGSTEGPKGLKGLGIREWTCECGAVHDRDTNAAKNILAKGLNMLERAFSVAGEAKASEAAANKRPKGLGVGYGPLAAGIPVL